MNSAFHVDHLLDFTLRYSKHREPRRRADWTPYHHLAPSIMYDDYRPNPDRRATRHSLPDTLYYDAPCTYSSPIYDVTLISSSQPLRYRLFPFSNPRYAPCGVDVLHLLIGNEQNPYHPSAFKSHAQRRLPPADERESCVSRNEGWLRACQSTHGDFRTSREGGGRGRERARSDDG